MNILDPSYGGRSWLRVVRDSLALVGVSITCKEQRHNREDGS